MTRIEHIRTMSVEEMAEEIMEIGIIDSKAMEMYMAGISDVKIARAFGVSPMAVFKWRTERGLPNNKDLFAWQKTYDGFIPEKYRKPKE